MLGGVVGAGMGFLILLLFFGWLGGDGQAGLGAIFIGVPIGGWIGAVVGIREARLGREAIETAYVLKQLVTAGVRVFFYLEDRERTLESPMDKAMLSLTTFADEVEREKAQQRTYDAMLRKAKAGHVTGGRVFGYDNVAVTGPSGERSHVRLEINEAEATIVRTIFDLAARGEGLKTITRPRGRTPETRERSRRAPGSATPLP